MGCEQERVFEQSATGCSNNEAMPEKIINFIAITALSSYEAFMESCDDSGVAL